MVKYQEAPPVDLQPRLDEKREALEARIAAMEAAAPPPPAEVPAKSVSEKAKALDERLHPPAPKKAAKK